MPHTQPVKLGPPDVDHFLHIMVRAGVTTPDTQYQYAFELLAAIEEIALQLRSNRLRGVIETIAGDGLRDLANLACDHLNGRVTGRHLAEETIRAAKRAFGDRSVPREAASAPVLEVG